MVFFVVSSERPLLEECLWEDLVRLILALFALVPCLALAADESGRAVAGFGRNSLRNVNDPLPSPSLTLEEVQHLRVVGTLLLSEVDLNVPHMIRGVRREFLSAREIINLKAASAVAYGLKVAIRDPSQSCAERICVVLQVVGRAQPKK